MSLARFLIYCKEQGKREFSNWVHTTPRKMRFAQVLLFAVSTLVWYYIFF